MALEDIVSVAISASSRTPTRPGFGTPLIAASDVPTGAPVVATFGSLAEMLDAGYTVNDPAYKQASIIKSASPSVKRFKIGKRTLPPTKLIKLTVTNATEGYVYTGLTVNGVAVPDYTVLAAATTTSVATALAALITALDAVTSATSAAAVITITAAAGVLFDVTGWDENAMTFADDTLDPGIATDLAAWAVADVDWYGLLGGPEFGKLENAAAFAWAQANKKLFMGDTCDSECADPLDTNDACSAAKALAYTQGAYWCNNTQFFHFTAAGIMGAIFPTKPGQATWKFKTLPGVPVSTWTEGEKTAIFAKNGNTYTTVAGLGITESGITPGGEWIDIVHGLAWLESEIKVRVFAALANAPKIPYTNAGRDVILSIIEGALADAVKVGLLAADPEPFATGPDVADIDSSIRATRLFPDLEFNGRLAGAIHAVDITGTLSV